LEPGNKFTVDEMLKGIVLESANDASLAMAEHIAGTEGAFVELMNAHAKRIGMTGTTYVNSHGLPAPEQRTTARDMAKLSVALIRDVPEEYKIYAEKEYEFNEIEVMEAQAVIYIDQVSKAGNKASITEFMNILQIYSDILSPDSQLLNKEKIKEVLKELISRVKVSGIPPQTLQKAADKILEDEANSLVPKFRCKINKKTKPIQRKSNVIIVDFKRSIK
jgi:hypothetical protein